MGFTEVTLRKLELDEIVPPLLYCGKIITQVESLKYLRGKQGGREQVDNLVYDCSQMPNSTTRDTNGWHVHWFNANQHRGTKIILHNEKDEKKDAIYVHNTKNNNPSKHIQDLVSHCIINHTPVRKKMHEKGTMATCGLRREIKCSGLTCYRPGKHSTEKTKKATNSLYNFAATDFFRLLNNTPMRTIYQNDIDQLKRDDLVWRVNDYRQNKHKAEPRIKLALHPTSAISMNLTNAMHVDKDDAIRSTAIFYSSPSNPGTTFLLFPFYGLAIECTFTTILNWDGKKQFHCSCTMPTGSNVFSFFNGAWESVRKQKDILRMFELKRPKRSMLPKTKIYFRIKHNDCASYSLQRQDYDLYGNKYSLLLAEIVGICNKDTKHKKYLIKFVNSKLYDGVLTKSVCIKDCVSVDIVEEMLYKLKNKRNNEYNNI